MCYLTSLHSWTQLALLGYPVKVGASCQHSTRCSIKERKQVFSHLLWKWSFLLSFPLHCLSVCYCCDVRAGPSSIWAPCHQRNCPAPWLQVTQAPAVPCCWVGHQENVCAFFLSCFSSPICVGELLPTHVSWSLLVGFTLLHTWQCWTKDWWSVWGLMVGQGCFLTVRNFAMCL